MKQKYIIAFLAICAIAVLLAGILKPELFERLYAEARYQGKGLRQQTKKSVSMDYKALENICQQKENVECCMASLRAMRENSYFLASEDGSENYGCPEGYKRNMMRCIDSLKWCQPAATNEP